jgi:nucleoside phosphorylase
MGKYLQKPFEIAPDQIGVSLEVSQRIGQLKDDRRFFVELAERYPGERPNNIARLIPGPVASGSGVLASEGTLEIKAQNRKVIGIEMELYGMYSAARDSGPPRPAAFGLKSVCDFADHLKNDKYQKYAAYTSAQVLAEFVRRYGVQLTRWYMPLH